MRHRLPGRLVGLAASLRSMPTASCEVSRSPSTKVDKRIPCHGSLGGKQIMSSNYARCCASNLITAKDAIAASIACHAPVSSPRRSLMIFQRLAADCCSVSASSGEKNFQRIVDATRIHGRSFVRSGRNVRLRLVITGGGGDSGPPAAFVRPMTAAPPSAASRAGACR